MIGLRTRALGPAAFEGDTMSREDKEWLDTLFRFKFGGAPWTRATLAELEAAARLKGLDVDRLLGR